MSKNEVYEIDKRKDYFLYKRKVLNDVLNFCVKKGLFPVGEEIKPDGDIVITLQALPEEFMKKVNLSSLGESL